jgi:hypothetical protein
VTAAAEVRPELNVNRSAVLGIRFDGRRLVIWLGKRGALM